MFSLDNHSELEETIYLENAIDIKYNKNYPVVMANKLARARKDKLTSLEAKLLRLAISNICELDSKLNTYNVSITELAELLGISSSNIYTEVKGLANSLMSKEIHISLGYDKNGNENFELFHWIDYCRYKDGIITIRLSEFLKPYLLGLDKLFTRYGYDTVLALPSDTAIKLYELLISFEGLRINNIKAYYYPEIETEPGEFVFPIENLRIFLNCEDKYPNNRDFIKWVIDSNLDIIMKNTLARITYRLIRKGRAIKYIVFKFIGLYEDIELENRIKKLKGGKERG